MAKEGYKAFGQLIMEQSVGGKYERTVVSWSYDQSEKTNAGGYQADRSDH